MLQGRLTMTSGCGTRRTEDKPGSASGITIWLRGKSSSLRDDFPRRLKGLFFPRIKLLKRAPLLVSRFGRLSTPTWNLSASKSGRRKLSLARRTNSICSRASAKSPTFSVFTKKANLSRKANPWTKRQPSFRLPRFRGERSEESLLEGLHVGDHVFNLVVVNHVFERRHQ